ncbi:MAG: NADP-dependent oxidoreductase [Acidimicrobiales bacterium]|nr:NADP-dependent oxidoreductase [Acidimicrobiales bacterium]
MSDVNRQVVLRQRPSGLVGPDDVELVEAPMPQIGDGEALVRNDLVGVDAAVRTWLDGQPGYLPALELGDPVRAATVGTVVETRCDAYEVGDVVTSLGGFSDYSVSLDDLFTTRVGGPDDDVDRGAMLAVYGSTGATAYFGMHDIGKPQEGETVVVSAAAGATGSIAGQIAKEKGARVVGIAGSDEKCRVAVEEFGFDACINHRTATSNATWPRRCASTARSGSTCTSTTSAGRSSTPSSAASHRAGASSCAA